MQALVIVQSMRLLARTLWYGLKLLRWMKNEDIMKLIKESQLHLLGWSLLVIIMISEALA